MKNNPGRSFDILTQPDDSTCGPTCLHAIYRDLGLAAPLEELIADIPTLPSGGCLAVNMACHALEKGFDVELFTYNLRVFDPTWFTGGVDIASRLRTQASLKKDSKLERASGYYLEFLQLGGQLRYRELTAGLLESLLAQGPVLVGLSATYLYGCAREYEDEYDDIRGDASGHFVVLTGFEWSSDREETMVVVADPFPENPRFNTNHYQVSVDHIIGAILLGITTYDANLLIVRPKERNE